ncbi:MAG: energy-coupling factor transporter transmembrane component T [Dehalococcoidia bacterium]
MHPGSWVAWLALAMGVALSTTNPLYLVVLILTLSLVAVLAPRAEGVATGGVRAVLLFGGGMFALSLIVAVVNGSYGDHILFTVPGPSFPSWMGGLSLGGPISAEGLVAAAIRGTAITCIVVAFFVFSSSVSPQRLLRTSPAALFQAGLVLTVGLTLVPSVVEDLRRVREVRALRGASNGFRSLPSLAVPILLGGLERAMRTAEAMEARGYAAASPVPRIASVAVVVSPALGLAAASVWFFYPGFRWLAVLAAVGGGVAFAVWLRFAARSRRTTRYRPEPIAPAERVAALCSCSLAVAVVLGLLPGLDLGYNPFAGLPWPAFGPQSLLPIAACAWPLPFVLATPASSGRARRLAEVPA